MNFQDVLREVYDSNNKALKISGSISVSAGNVTLNPSPNFIGLTTSTIGNSLVTVTLGTKLDSTNDSVDIKSGATVTPVQAWPDPHTYIGLVTITGSLAAASGNVTLDPGSKTQIIGNLTLSDPKGFIGLVTVVGSLSAAAGNITLDPGSKTQIVGNVTLSDSKGYIGLTTVTPGAAWPDPKGYIGLVTITGSLSAAAGNVTLDPGSKTGIVGNITITDGKTYIGLVTATVGNTVSTTFSGNVTLDAGSKTQIVGNVSISSNVAWPDPKGYIGLVTITGSLAAAAGNVTLDPGSKTGIVGNLTLSDSKGYIGLVTATPGAAWPDPKGYIGLVTITGSLAAAAGNVTLDPGSKTQITGNLTLSDSKGFIGLVSVSHAAWADPKTFIGLVTASNGLAWTDPKTYIGLVTATMVGSVNTGMLTIFPGPNYIGLASVNIGGTLPALPVGTSFIGLVTVAPHALTVGTAFVGLVTAFNSNQQALVASAAFIGLVSVMIGANVNTNIGLVTISGGAAWADPKTFIGLTTTTVATGTANIGIVTVNRNSLSTTINVALAATNISGATLWVSAASKKSYITNLLLSANATVGVNIKVGTTYLIGNNSLYVTLYPGGGWVENSGPLTPLYSNMTVAEAFQICTNTAAMVAGRITWFDE